MYFINGKQFSGRLLSASERKQRAREYAREEAQKEHERKIELYWDNFCFVLGLIFMAVLFVSLTMDQFLFVYEHGFVPNGYIFDILLTFIGSFVAGWILYGAMEDREQFFNMSGLAILVYIAYSIFS